MGAGDFFFPVQTRVLRNMCVYAGLVSARSLRVRAPPTRRCLPRSLRSAYRPL